MRCKFFSIIVKPFSVKHWICLFVDKIISHMTHSPAEWPTVDSEIFVRILFSRLALKYVFATIKIHDLDMIYLHQ